MSRVCNWDGSRCWTGSDSGGLCLQSDQSSWWRRPLWVCCDTCFCDVTPNVTSPPFLCCVILDRREAQVSCSALCRLTILKHQSFQQLLNELLLCFPPQVAVETLRHSQLQQHCQQPDLPAGRLLLLSWVLRLRRRVCLPVLHGHPGPLPGLPVHVPADDPRPHFGTNTVCSKERSVLKRKPLN